MNDLVPKPNSLSLVDEIAAFKRKAVEAMPKFIDIRPDLPSGHIVMEAAEALKGMRPEERVKVSVYMPTLLKVLPPTLAGKVTRKFVWLLFDARTSPDDRRSIELSVRDKLRKVGFDVLGQAVPTSASVLHSLHEDSTSTGNTNTVSADAKESEVAIYFENLLKYCLAERISDIHIEKRQKQSYIRLRKHGQLMVYDPNISNSFSERLSRVIYEIFATDKDIVFRDDEFQVASVDWEVGGEAVKLRFQSLPTYLGGFDVVMRVLPIGTDEEVITPLDKLGYSQQQVKTLLEIAGRPVGALVIAGTTGSGKSTTLKNLLMYINNSRDQRCKIYTIEDPPEYKIPNVSQIPVNRASAKEGESPFAMPLKATMRGDPDILMIGEIRDNVTGDGLKKATQSGHQVLTTIHATRALGIPPRLKDFGLTSNILGSSDFLTGLIYQRLFPVLCPHCSIPFRDIISSSTCSEQDTELAERLQEVADFSIHDIRVKRKGGCEKCGGMGIVDRTVCAEIVSPDLKMLHAFTKDDMLLAEYHWRSLSDGDLNSDNMTGKTVLEHALSKMMLGKVSPHDIEEMLDPVNSAHRRWLEMQEMVKELYKK